MTRLHMRSNHCHSYRPDAPDDPCIEPEQTALENYPGSPSPASMQPRVISISRRGAGLLT